MTPIPYHVRQVMSRFAISFFHQPAIFSGRFDGGCAESVGFSVPGLSAMQ